MESFAVIFGLVLTVLAILATYHIAFKQGIFRQQDVLFTLSMPTPFKKGEIPPEYAEVRKIGNLKYPDSYPDLIYPYLLRRPLIVAFGIMDPTKVNALYLLMTIVNRTGASVEDVTCNIELPEDLMPDRIAEVGIQKGITVRRSIDKATKQGNIEYNLDLKPYDCVIIPEAIVLDSSHISGDAKKGNSRDASGFLFHSVRCVLRTSDVVREERFWVTGIEAKDIETLIKQSLAGGSTFIDRHINSIKKPLLRRLLKVPYGDRTLLWCNQAITSQWRALPNICMLRLQIIQSHRFWHY